MAQTNKGFGSGEIAIAILNNNGGAPPYSTADRSQPSPTANSYTATDAEHLQKPKAPSPSPSPSPSPVPAPAPARGDQQKFHKFLSTTAKLGYFLPTGTSLLFDTAVPNIYRNGQCSYTGKILMWLLIGLCVAICAFSYFTDINNSDNAKDDRNEKVKYKIVKWSELKFADVVHVITSVIAFLTIAFSDQRAVDCVLPAHVKEVEDAMVGLHVIVLSVCSFLYLAFPSKRSGMVPKLAYNENVKRA